MWLLGFGVFLLVLKLIGFPSQMEQLSWWWISIPFLGAFLWFDVIERRLGRDKKKAFDELEAAKKERIKKALERDKNFNVRR